ncbi:bifunctional 4-hydroxy-2-oxoglutarate aldolase/2-dehydro-3-deoxy-phosphogluconate aldolase [Fulvivirgaceae bacterium BMA10]|uniref:Bifunctional 4-hydroxy-2-oxoglutarate aldolase/2-dehydro-3-deoxy-phosphogluconate aldolase n=1 Tax=Splendidivirga corallicola TaxID=3051826 RepID=A0ABT8KKQ1_9BACT|nr:bifunctional 4-hydroxy-2-oxoglutarate aldolase/2-dehydro-3-deoxy-phosphogluconate aldolase [Fulvivirgaceae bacterium BMA10]
MAKFTRIDITKRIEQAGFLPLFNYPDAEIGKQIIKSCYDAGVRAFEFTNRSENSLQVFQQLLEYTRNNAPEMALGIGSIVDGPTTALFIQAGADFVVSPILNAEMAKICNRRKILWIPGCGSLTEISSAEELGAEVVKVFPAAQLGGASFIKAIKGPCPWTTIMATGGVQINAEDLKKWFDAGVSCVGIGSNLFTKEIIELKDFDLLSKNISEVLSTIQTVKN